MKSATYRHKWKPEHLPVGTEVVIDNAPWRTYVVKAIMPDGVSGWKIVTTSQETFDKDQLLLVLRRGTGKVYKVGLLSTTQPYHYLYAPHLSRPSRSHCVGSEPVHLVMRFGVAQGVQAHDGWSDFWDGITDHLLKESVIVPVYKNTLIVGYTASKKRLRKRVKQLLPRYRDTKRSLIEQYLKERAALHQAVYVTVSQPMEVEDELTEYGNFHFDE